MMVTVTFIDAFGTVLKDLGKKDPGNWKSEVESRPSWPNIVNNIHKSPVDLRSLVVSQTSVKDHLLKLVWKTHMD